MIKRFIQTVTTVFLFSSVAWAGVTSYQPVEIDIDNMSAKGNMVDARFTANKFERIGCGLSTYVYSDGETSVQGWCQVSLSEGKNTICFTEVPDMLEMIKSIDDYSYISFRWDKSGDCSFIHISTQLQYIL